MHLILGMVVGVDSERQTPGDANRVRSILRTIGFKKVRPATRWFDSSYAYDVNRDTIPHIWAGIEAAVRLADQQKLSGAPAKT